jgi:glutaminyl-tRNA synthetase
VSAAHALPAEIRLYEYLFTRPDPGADGRDLFDDLNPDSERIVNGFVEPSLATAQPGESVQFERLGYFAVDPDSAPGSLVFNRTVTLKDAWAKAQAKA